MGGDGLRRLTQGKVLILVLFSYRKMVGRNASHEMSL